MVNCARWIQWFTARARSSDRARYFKSAQLRRKHLMSIDKANVLENGVLWRDVVTRVAAEYPDVTLEHMFVDNAAMQFLPRPTV